MQGGDCDPVSVVPSNGTVKWDQQAADGYWRRRWEIVDDTATIAEARNAELEKLPAFKLKAAAKEAGVPPLAIGVPVRTKEETIALILELEAGAGGGAGAQPVSAGARPPPAPTSVAPRAPPAPAAPQTSMSRSVSKPGRGAVEELVE